MLLARFGELAAVIDGLLLPRTTRPEIRTNPPLRPSRRAEEADPRNGDPM